MSTIAPHFSSATDGSPADTVSWGSPVARRDPSHRLPLPRIADPEQKPGSATTEPLRCLDLRGCGSVFVGPVVPELFHRHGANSRLVFAYMKVAYVFSTSGHTASYKLGKMILPQLEQGTHGVEVVGMFFFDDNTYVLRAGDPLGERLGKVAAEQGMLLMLCDQCALERSLAEGEIGAAVPKDTVDGVRVGCFPDLYAALAGNPPDHVITL
jgi:sulfur relay (sulfurtransferase) complex TusBCD TusD component (DsrE family)